MRSDECCVSVRGLIAHYGIIKINDSRTFMLEWNHNTNILERRNINFPFPLEL